VSAAVLGSGPGGEVLGEEVLGEEVPALRDRRPAARHGWATHSLQMVATSTGDLVPEVPGELYAGIAGWRSQRSWLQAVQLHPRVEEAARRHETCPDALRRVMAMAASYADPVTGRGIGVAHGTLARKLGVSSKTVKRCFWAAEDLGLLERVLDGSDMTLTMRMQVRDHYPKGSRRGTRSKLPNFYAATIPRWLATRLPGVHPKPARGTTFAGASVDNSRPPMALSPGNVHPPVGGTTPQKSHLTLWSGTTTFSPACGQPAGTEPRTDRTAAARPTKAHQGTSTARPARRLDPAVEQFARALRRELVGFRDVSLPRICPALSLYVRAGLNPSDLRRGLDDYLAATGRTWLTSWQADQAEQQARYLIGMLTRARMTGYIRLPEPNDPDNHAW
jgi:hypothetical protein